MDDKKTFQEEVIEFIMNIKSLKNTFPVVITTIDEKIIESAKEIKPNLKGLVELIRNIQEDKPLKKEGVPKYIEMLKKFAHLHISKNILQRSFIMALMSQYDAYLGRLLKIIFMLKPEMINTSAKVLTFEQIMEYGSKEEIVEHMFNKEVDTFLREGHVEQFEWLEKKLDMTLRTGLDVWPCFVEITERRNLFAHCDGVVSGQYLNICKKNGVKFEEECRVGDKLEVDSKYFNEAYKCLFEIGVKLAHVIWRKIMPQERKDADSGLNNICYDLLCDEDYDLAKIILKFANDLKKYHNGEGKLLFVVNRAMAYKWSGGEEECKKIIDENDWSMVDNKFKLAKYVLTDQFEEASALMIKIGNRDEDVDELAYHHWPLFKEFRKSSIFLDTYEKIFGKKFELWGKELLEELKEVEGIKEELEVSDHIEAELIKSKKSS